MTSATPNSVLFVGAYPRPAPLERFVSGDLAGRLVSRAWKVRVTSRQTGRLGRLAAIVWGAWRGGSRCDIACVDVFSGAAFTWAQAACVLLRWARKPYVITLHGGNLPDFGNRHPARVGKLLASAAAVTCPSPYLVKAMRRFRPDLMLIPNGVDLSQYHFEERRAPLLRLMWLRAFHEMYNPVMAVEIVSLLRQQGINVTLCMIGPDKGDGSLERTRSRAKELEVDACVQFPGPIAKEDVPAWLQKGDIFLNTTDVDNTPVSVIEAMASGLVVISTNVGGIPDLIHDGQDGLLVTPRDPERMASAVRTVIEDRTLAVQLSTAARAKVESFDWSVVLPQWLELFQSVCKQPA
ncbi:MAG TPA: glycosyltransferase [Verrucomicrobiales bacterium]|nr:glycosyltransferase [Verrucomicrobiales bacterium]